MVESVSRKQVQKGSRTPLSTPEAARILASEVSRWTDPCDRPVVLLKTLCELAQGSSPDRDRALFTTKEIAEAIDPETGFWGRTSSGGKPIPDESGDRSRAIRNSWKRLCEQRSEAIKGVFRRAGLGETLELTNDSGLGGAGRHASYGFRLVWAGAPQAIYAPPIGGVEYRLEKGARPPGLLVSTLTGGGLYGWRLAGLGIIAAFIGLYSIAAILVFMVFAFDGGDSAQSMAGSLMALAAALWMVFPIYKIGRDRLIRAPWWLQPLRFDAGDGYLLELRPGSSGGRNSLHLALYRGTCPVCGGSLLVSGGRKEFSGRFVGRCNYAPNEHVYSFDHVTLTGAPLRPQAQRK